MACVQAIKILHVLCILVPFISSLSSGISGLQQCLRCQILGICRRWGGEVRPPRLATPASDRAWKMRTGSRFRKSHPFGLESGKSISLYSLIYPSLTESWLLPFGFSSMFAKLPLMLLKLKLSHKLFPAEGHAGHEAAAQV